MMGVGVRTESWETERILCPTPVRDSQGIDGSLTWKVSPCANENQGKDFKVVGLF